MTMKTLGPMIVSLLLVARVAAQEPPKSQPPIWSAKPDVAAFEAAENDRLASVQRAVEQVVAVKGARTVENTLAPFDEATRQLNAAYYLASTMEQVHPEAAFRDHASAMVRKASAVQTALSLNRDVYQALAGLDLSAADASTRYYVQRQLLEFRLAGVDKDDATRARLKKLNDELTNDQSMFERNIADDQNTVEVADASELDGLPQDYIENHKPGADGKIHITTNYPDIFPPLKYSKSDALRRRLEVAFDTRAYPKNRDCAQGHDADALRDRDAARLFLLGRLLRGGQDDPQRQEHCGFHSTVGRSGPSLNAARIRAATRRETEDRSGGEGNLGLRSMLT